MKRIPFFLVAVVLLLSHTASAELMVYEYEPGEKVTLDTVTGKYWYWNLQEFVEMNYDEQMSAISGISPTFGGIAGGWHMASLLEMQPFWTNSGTDIMAAFGSPTGAEWPSTALGRYDEPYLSTSHIVAGRWDGTWVSMGVAMSLTDDYRASPLFAWVTTDATVVPVPPSVVMAMTGFLTLLGVKLRGRWRRR